MDINKLIESGDLELYILGALSPEQEARIDAWRAENPDLHQTLLALEADFEALAFASAQTPPPALQAQIQAQVLGPSQAPPQPRQAYARLPWLLFGLMAVSASLVLFWQHQQHQQAQKNWQSQSQNLESQLQSQNQHLQSCQSILQDTATQKIFLRSTQTQNPQQLALVYWNAQSKQVLALTQHLPPPPPQKQYQLWALADGKPIDLGVLPLDTPPQGQNIQAQLPPKIDAFAITLEPLGGQAQPSLDQLHVLGNLST